MLLVLKPSLEDEDEELSRVILSFGKILGNHVGGGDKASVIVRHKGC